jgi:hypothetical protein
MVDGLMPVLAASSLWVNPSLVRCLVTKTPKTRLPSVTFFRDGANRRPVGLPLGPEPVRRAGDPLTPLRLTVVVRFPVNLKPLAIGRCRGPL